MVSSGFTIDNLRQTGQIKNKDTTGSEEAVKEGVYDGNRVVQEDISSMIADAAEELTFSASEVVEKEISQRDLRRDRGDRLSEYVKKAEFYLKHLPDIGSPKKLQDFLEHVKNMGDTSPEKLRQESRKFFKDSSHAYAALSYVKDVLEETGGEDELKDSLTLAMKMEMQEHGEEIRAGFNITSTAYRFSSEGLGDTGELRDFYRDNILEYDGLKSLQASLVERTGGDLSKMISFLMEALGTDLNSGKPSMEPVQLKKIVDDIYNLEVLSNCKGMMEGVSSTMERLFSVHLAMSPVELAESLLKLKEQKWIVTSNVEDVVKKCGLRNIEEQICFLREFLEVARSLPFKVFAEGEDRGKLLDVIQETMDSVIEEEE